MNNLKRDWLSTCCWEPLTILHHWEMRKKRGGVFRVHNMYGFGSKTPETPFCSSAFIWKRTWCLLGRSSPATCAAGTRKQGASRCRELSEQTSGFRSLNCPLPYGICVLRDLCKASSAWRWWGSCQQLRVPQEAPVSVGESAHFCLSAIGVPDWVAFSEVSNIASIQPLFSKTKPHTNSSGTVIELDLQEFSKLKKTLQVDQV